MYIFHFSLFRSRLSRIFFSFSSQCSIFIFFTTLIDMNILQEGFINDLCTFSRFISRLQLELNESASFKGQIHWLSIIVWFNSTCTLHSLLVVSLRAIRFSRFIDDRVSRESRVFANVISQLLFWCSHESSNYKDKFNISFFFQHFFLLLKKHSQNIFLLSFLIIISRVYVCWWT